MTYYFFSVVPEVLLEAFDGIFDARFFKIKNVEQNKKNVKKRKKPGKNKKRKKRFFTSMVQTMITKFALLSAPGTLVFCHEVCAPG